MDCPIGFLRWLDWQSSERNFSGVSCISYQCNNRAWTAPARSSEARKLHTGHQRCWKTVVRFAEPPRKTAIQKPANRLRGARSQPAKIGRLLLDWTPLAQRAPCLAAAWASHAPGASTIRRLGEYSACKRHLRGPGAVPARGAIGGDRAARRVRRVDLLRRSTARGRAPATLANAALGRCVLRHHA
jgi:hypothetical protein